MYSDIVVWLEWVSTASPQEIEELVDQLKRDANGDVRWSRTLGALINVIREVRGL